MVRALPSLGRASYPVQPPSRGSINRRVMIIGANLAGKRRSQTRASASRWRATNLKIGVIGEKADLNLRLRLSRRGAETLGPS